MTEANSANGAAATPRGAQNAPKLGEERAADGGVHLSSRPPRPPRAPRPSRAPFGSKDPVAFVAPAERMRVHGRMEDAGFLVVTVDAIGALARGRLADIVDEAIERDLTARGAAPPGIGATSGADVSLGDQLFRARRVGAVGICLSLGTLRAATSARGALDAEDSATLRFWAEAARDCPVSLLLDDEDAALGAYAEPVSLLSLIDPTDRNGAANRAVRANAENEADAAEMAADARAAAHSDAAPTEVTADSPSPPRGPEGGPSTSHLPEAEAAEADVANVEVAEAEVATAEPPTVETPAAGFSNGKRTTVQTSTTRASNLDAPKCDVPVAEIASKTEIPPTRDAPRAHEAAASGRSQMAGASIATDDDAWRGWTLALTSARGPQPLSAFERLFSNDYLPLANAIASGLDDPRALHAHDEFRRTFTRAYAEACPTFALTGKRPRMVFDAPDVAAKIARLHGARSVHLLLVDAMRLDLGERVRNALARTFGTRASLTDELILWSALPTTSMRQLETLARGVDALRTAPESSDRDAEPLRGRTAEVIRRVKIGARDVYKLDVVEARLHSACVQPARTRGDGGQIFEAMAGIADAAADAIARHAATLPARTLLFVFGDHGFTVDRDGTAHSGGASPEEVLVPAYGFLLGEVH